jgi:hypothetical protein
LKVIVEAFHLLLDNEEIFYTWFLSENADLMTPLDLSAQYSNRDIVNYVYEVVKKTSEDRLKLTESRKNIFHHAAKANQAYPIVFFYKFRFFSMKNYMTYF